MRPCIAAFCLILLWGAIGAAQRGHRDPTPDDRNANPDRLVTTQQIDARLLRSEADELAMLAASVPADVTQATGGLLPKGLNDKLKRIEKLSKHLRTELAVGR